MAGDMHAYKAYLIARQVAEDFLLSHGRIAGQVSPASYSNERGHDHFKELAAFLGYRVEKIKPDQNAEAA